MSRVARSGAPGGGRRRVAPKPSGGAGIDDDQPRRVAPRPSAEDDPPPGPGRGPRSRRPEDPFGFGDEPLQAAPVPSAVGATPAAEESTDYAVLQAQSEEQMQQASKAHAEAQAKEQAEKALKKDEDRKKRRESKDREGAQAKDEARVRAQATRAAQMEKAKALAEAGSDGEMQLRTLIPGQDSLGLSPAAAAPAPAPAATPEPSQLNSRGTEHPGGSTTPRSNRQRQKIEKHARQTMEVARRNSITSISSGASSVGKTVSVARTELSPEAQRTQIMAEKQVRCRHSLWTFHYTEELYWLSSLQFGSRSAIAAELKTKSAKVARSSRRRLGDVGSPADLQGKYPIAGIGEDEIYVNSSSGVTAAN